MTPLGIVKWTDISDSKISCGSRSLRDLIFFFRQEITIKELKTIGKKNENQNDECDLRSEMINLGFFMSKILGLGHAQVDNEKKKILIV